MQIQLYINGLTAQSSQDRCW